jgi:hypothetical protein
VKNLAEKLIICVVHADTIAKCQGRVEGEALDVWPDADFLVGVGEIAVLVHVSNDAKALQVEHRVIAAHCRLREGRTGGFPLVFATGIPGATSNCKALGTADNSMESVELRTVDYSVVVFHQDVTASFKRVEDDCASVAKLDLKDRILVLAPPFLAR